MDARDRVWRERGLREAVLAGDEHAWRVWDDESCGPLYAYILWRCGGLHDRADEIAQETWLTAVRRLSSFDPGSGSFAGWLHGIAANLLRNRFRQNIRRHGRPTQPECTTTAPVDAELLRREQAEAVAGALAALPEHYEAVLRAKYLDGQSVADIALARGDSLKAVESLLTRARDAFALPTNPMSDAMHQADPLDTLLAPRPGSPRDEVLSQTLRALRKQRRLRRLGSVGVLLAAYAAGLLTVQSCHPPTAEKKVIAVRPTPPAQPALPPVQPSALEWQAIDQPAAAPMLYRQAGDEYLADADPAEAVRCYGNALSTGNDKDLDVSTDDSWLLMAIKQARKNERKQCDK